MTGSPSPAPQRPLLLSPYDILKTLAVILMIVDHIGLYFVSGEEIFRLLGRFCVPIWLFLIGYARSRRIDALLLGSAVYISALHFLLLSQLHTLNILWTIIALRLTLNPLMRWIGTSEDRLLGVTALCFLLALPSRAVLDYGTLAWILGIWGYLVRHNRPEHDWPGKDTVPQRRVLITAYGILTLGLYAVTETLQFSFTLPSILCLAAGCALLFPALARYLPSGRMVGAGWPLPLRRLIAVIGRQTLWIYTAHLTVFIGLLLWQRFVY